MRRIAATVVSAFLAATAAWGAPTNSPAPRLITLDECIASALERNFEIRMERAKPRAVAYNLAAASGAYEPTFLVGAGRAFLDQPGTFDPKKTGTDAPYELTRDTAEAGLSGLLPTGLKYHLGGSANLLDARTDFNLTQGRAGFPNGIRATNEYYSTTGITLRQPLLKDFWIDSTRLLISVERQSLRMSELGLRWKIMSTISKVETVYHEWVYAREQVAAREEALELVKNLLTATKKAIGNGLLPETDDRLVAAEVESATVKVLAAELAADLDQAALRNLISDRYREETGHALTPATALSRTPLLISRSESWRRAIEQRPDLLEARSALEKERVLIRYRKNQLFPNLDLVGGYGVQGWNQSFGGTLGELRDQNHPSYSYGVVLSFPIGGNQSAKNKLRASKEVMDQIGLGIQKLEQDILAEVDVATMRVESTFKQAESARRARQLAEEGWRAAEAKVEFGKTTILELIEMQERLTANRTAEARALADYNNALAQLALSDGTVLERNHLELRVK